MNEVLPGIWHWTVIHERIHAPVHSYYIADSASLIDPMVPPEGVEWFAEHGPDRILLTNRHHYRHSARFVDAYGCEVFCHEAGLHEFEGGPEVHGVSVGDVVAPGITLCEVDAICPDDAALHIDIGDGALAFTDGLMRSPSGELAFAKDAWLGEDPSGVKEGLLSSLRRLVEEQTFDSLLFAHGIPLIGGGKEALREFVKLNRDERTPLPKIRGLPYPRSEASPVL